ncbi:MAG: ParM/StbA family protein [Clostridium saudiense]|uniref:ParM/StbA family protein n=1 Tax=Clostridium saudiense TaxID=1414720 RepID=UPI003991F760
MAQGKRKEIYKYKCFIDAIKFNVIKDLESDKTLSRNAIIKKYNLSGEITSRFKWSRNENDTPDKVILTHFNLNATAYKKDVWVEIPTHYVDITKKIIENNYEISSSSEVINKIIRVLEEKGEVNSMNIKIAADLGNNNVKVAINGQAFSFVNKIERWDNVETLGDNEYIKMNDDFNYYIISNIDTKFEKSSSKKDKNFIPTLNYSIIKALVEAGVSIEDKIEVDLALLTAINQSVEKDEYVEKIKRNSDNIVECKVNGKEYMANIKINNVVPMLEGCSSAFLLEDLSGINTIVDIGSRTINIAKIVKGKFSTIECLEDIGSFNYYQSLVSKINNRDITINNIQEMIEVGLANHDKDLLKSYLKKVLEESNKVTKFKTNNNVYFTGGTVELFKSQGLNFEKGNIKVMDNPVYSNVLGALKVVGGAK